MTITLPMPSAGNPWGFTKPLRLWVQEDVTQPLAMQVQVLKRKGPPLAQPLVLPAGSARLAQVLAAAQDFLHDLAVAGAPV